MYIINLTSKKAEKAYVDAQISSLIGGLAPETFDTIKEIGDYLSEYSDTINLISSKLDSNSEVNGGSYGSYNVEGEV